MVDLRLVLAAAVLAGFAAGGWWLHQTGYKAGSAATEVKWQAKEAEAQKAAQKRLQAVQSAHAKTSADFQRKLQDADVENRRMAAALRSGEFRLRFPSASRAPDFAPTPGGCDGGAPSELPSEVAGNLWQLAADADAVAEQLAACQAVVRADRGG